MKQAEHLKSANMELEQFAYVASHDLQEPLRMVKSFLTLIDTKYSPSLDEKGKKYIHYAVDGAERMEILIKDLLKYTLTITDQEVNQIDLNELLKEVLNLIRRNIQEQGALIEIGELPTLSINKTAILQVFLNLITNALKYQDAESSPIINIDASEKESDWLFTVKDNGIGIAKENLEKVFVIFKRLHSKNEFSGTGLGLALCKKIIERNGGKIWVESEVGKGSSFYFTLLK